MTEILSPTHIVVNDNHYFLISIPNSRLLRVTNEDTSTPLWFTFWENWYDYIEHIQMRDLGTLTTLDTPQAKLAIAYHSVVNPERFI